MRLFVDEMPLSEYECPFSEEHLSRVLCADKNTYRYHHVMIYECSVTKEQCDLNCGACSGLRVFKGE